MRRCFVLSLLVFTLAGCVGYSIIEPARRNIGQAYSVEPQIVWSKQSPSDMETWTVDGVMLQSLRLYSGLEDGDPLFRLDAEDMPVFRKDMLAGEAVEFIVDSIAREGGANVRSSNLRPAPFGEEAGYRVDLTFFSNTGLEMRGLAAGTVVDDRLYLILYVGAASHYFPKYEDNVNRLIDSVRITGQLPPA